MTRSKSRIQAQNRSRESEPRIGAENPNSIDSSSNPTWPSWETHGGIYAETTNTSIRARDSTAKNGFTHLPLLCPDGLYIYLHLPAPSPMTTPSKRALLLFLQTLLLFCLQVDFDGSVQRLFEFLLRPYMPGDQPQLPAPSPLLWDARLSSRAGGSGSGTTQEVAALVAAAARFDTARHWREQDDGHHLSDLRRKRRLRALLLNHSIKDALTRWRRLSGYPASYAEFCEEYEFPFANEARVDGISL